MGISKVFYGVSRTGFYRVCNFVSTSPELFLQRFYSPRYFSSNSNQSVPFQVAQLLNQCVCLNTVSTRFMSNSSSDEKGKQVNQDSRGQETGGKHQNISQEKEETDGKVNRESNTIEPSEKRHANLDSRHSKSHSARRRRIVKPTVISDSEVEEEELSIDDLVNLVAEKEEQLKAKHKEIEKMQDKVLRSYADVENVIDRTKREAENSKKFAVQNFAKSLLDVADNLGRASSVVKNSFSKIDQSQDAAGAVPLLKTLLEGVEMTEKQLSEVFKMYGVEKFNPLNEHFDPHRHHAVFQIPDASKPTGTVAAVLKAGYMLYDRVIRPAEVGVTEATSDKTEERSEA